MVPSVFQDLGYGLANVIVVFHHEDVLLYGHGVLVLVAGSQRLCQIQEFRDATAMCVRALSACFGRGFSPEPPPIINVSLSLVWYTTLASWLASRIGPYRWPDMRKRRAARAGQYERPAYRELQKRLAKNTRRLREAMAWSQEEAAHRSDMATRLFQRVESANVNLTLTTIARLCEGFEVDVCQLFAPPSRGARGKGSSSG